MRSRRQSREAVLQALYQCDTHEDWSSAQIDLYYEVFHLKTRAEWTPSDEEHYEFSRMLVAGVVDKLVDIDRQLSGSSDRWSLKRMLRVDRNILRLAAFEILYCADIPVNVSMNEAIELAKRYGTEESPVFVNGVLDNLAATAKKAAAGAESATNKSV